MSGDDAVLPGHLYVVPTPIGNLGDLGRRAAQVLAAVDAIACEDTRRTWKLLTHLEIPRPGAFFACHDHNEAPAARRVCGLLETGRSVALCSDAGMPLVSDPGFVVLRSVREAGHPVVVIPGPSAVITALVASGLPVHAFTFKGFPPRRPGRRRRFFAEEAERSGSLVFFEAVPRLSGTLRAAAEALGERSAAVCFELTKRFERIERGTLAELAERMTGETRGEVTVVIAGVTRG